MVAPSDVQHASRCAAAWHFHQRDPDGGSVDEGAAGRRIGALLTRLRTRREPSIGFWLPMLVGGSAVAVTIAGIMLGERDTAGYVIIATALVLLQASAAILTLHLIDAHKEEKLRAALGAVPSELEGDFPTLQGPVTDAEWGLKGPVGTVVHSGGRHVPVVVAEGSGRKQVEPWMALRVGCSMRLLEVRDGKAPGYGLVAYPDGAFRVAYDDIRQPLRIVVESMRDAPPPDMRDHDDRARCATCPWRKSCQYALA